MADSKMTKKKESWLRKQVILTLPKNMEIL